MILTFKTPTRMSLLDVTSMGDSSKRGDTTTIGQFDSGLKYAILKNHKVELVGKMFSPNTIYRNSVTLESIPIKESEIVSEKGLSFRNQVMKCYDFDIGDLEIKTAKLKGNKVVSDKYNNCLIIDEEFSIEEDFYSFLIEYYIFTESGNIINILSKKLTEKLRK